jgi:adenylate cyclase
VPRISERDSCSVEAFKPDAAGLKVIVSLVDGLTGVHVWGDAHRTDLDPAGLVGFRGANCQYRRQQNLRRIWGDCQDPVRKNRNGIPPEELTTYQAMLRFYDFWPTFQPETFAGTFEALNRPAPRNRNADWCGACWPASIPSNYSLELFDLETPPGKSRRLCRKGVALEPDNQRTRLIMAFILLFKNELSAGLAEVDRALQLNPNSLITLENIGYLMTLFGDWQRGPGNHKKSDRTKSLLQQQSFIYALWVDWVRQKNTNRLTGNASLQKAPAVLGPVDETASLGLLGRIRGGRAGE